MINLKIIKIHYSVKRGTYLEIAEISLRITKVFRILIPVLFTFFDKTVLEMLYYFLKNNRIVNEVVIYCLLLKYFYMYKIPYPKMHLYSKLKKTK